LNLEFRIQDSIQDTRYKILDSNKMSEDKVVVDQTTNTNPPAEVEVPAKFEKLVGEIEKMSIIELAELVKVLENKFGVSAAAPVAAVVASAPAEEKTSFNVELKEVGAQKIEVIKIVRDLTAKGLKESKDLVDAVAAGTAQLVKEGIKKEEADEIVKKFEAVGAKAEIK
jgi:large subunit ribosomal protein L7/L12